MVRELEQVSPGVAERTLRRGFAEKLEARKITKVWKQLGRRGWVLIWEQIDGVWIPMDLCDYYDEKQTGENYD